MAGAVCTILLLAALYLRNGCVYAVGIICEERETGCALYYIYADGRTPTLVRYSSRYVGVWWGIYTVIFCGAPDYHFPAMEKKTTS